MRLRHSGMIALFGLICTSASFAGKLPYSYYRIGQSGDVRTSTTPGTVLMGGGTDVDAAFQWLCGLGGNGDVLVIRATGTDAYNPYIKQLCPNVNSVSTLIIPSLKAAQHPDVARIVMQAEAIWIAGGDQADYVNLWRGTPLQTALQKKIDNGTPVGGTSAGLNVLSQFIYSAQASKGVTSSQALADPFNRYMSFERDFVSIPILRDVMADPHFVTRDRMGRDLAFMGRIFLNGWSLCPRMIAVDEQTALLIDNYTGNTGVVGAGSVYFMKAPAGPAICQSQVPLTYTNIDVYRIEEGNGAFNLSQWTGAGGTAYKVSANAGVLGSTQDGGSPY